MIRKSTLFAIVILAGLIAFAIYLGRDKTEPADAEATPTADSYVLFGSEEGMPNHIVITSRMLNSVELSRADSGEWVIKLPVQATADPAQAEAAATEISALRVLGEPDLEPRDVGLSPAEYTISLGFTSGAEHELQIGDQTPTMSGYYARLDEDGQVLIVSAAGIESLLGMLDLPPYLETLTPTSLPVTATTTPSPVTETLVPTAGTETPESLPTATP